MSTLARTSGRVRNAGVLVLLVGVWGALVPYVGPTFGYDMGDTPAWTWTEARFTQHLLPGLAAVLGGLLLMRTHQRATQQTGAGIATLGGIGFLVVPSLHPLWAGQSMGGMSMGDSALSSALTSLGYHYGIGAVICVLGAYAWGALGASRSDDAQVRETSSRQDQPTGSESSLVNTRR